MSNAERTTPAPSGASTSAQLVAPRTFAGGCPDWCRLAPHDVDSGTPDGRSLRTHVGPSFGRFVSTYAEEYTDAPGVLTCGVWLNVEGDARDFTSPSDLLDFAAHLITASGWLEVRQ